MKAAETGAISLTRLLLRNLAEVNAINHKGRTPLSFAAQFWERGGPDHDVIRLLLQAKADPRKEDGSGKTPTCYSRSDNVKALLETLP